MKVQPIYTDYTDLYLNDDESFGICSASTIKSTSPSISSILNCHKLLDASE